MALVGKMRALFDFRPKRLKGRVPSTKTPPRIVDGKAVPCLRGLGVLWRAPGGSFRPIPALPEAVQAGSFEHRFLNLSSSKSPGGSRLQGIGV